MSLSIISYKLNTPLCDPEYRIAQTILHLPYRPKVLNIYLVNNELYINILCNISKPTKPYKFYVVLNNVNCIPDDIKFKYLFSVDNYHVFLDNR